MTERVITRLDKDVYEALVKRLPGIGVGTDTTELQAGYQLGVQHVLAILREGFVIG